jgi:hypothetical protein
MQMGNLPGKGLMSVPLYFMQLYHGQEISGSFNRYRNLTAQDVCGWEFHLLLLLSIFIQTIVVTH